MPQSASENVDVIIIGAGHNGLATASFLARNRLRVLVLEKNDYVGGMAGSREILTVAAQEEFVAPSQRFAATEV